MNHTKWVLEKHPVNDCGLRDDLSGDMFASSRHNFVFGPRPQPKIAFYTPEPSICLASMTITPPPPPRRRRKPQNPWVLPWIRQKEERGCYRTLLDELITTDIPGYRNFTGIELAFFYLIKERITPHLRKSITNFRKPLEVGLKLAVTLRYLSTGKT